MAFLEETDLRDFGMLDREQRDLLVVPYAPPPAPRRHLVAAALFCLVGVIALIGLAMADYSAIVTGWLIIAATAGFLLSAFFFVTGVRARRQFRVEMERAEEPVPVQPAAETSSSVEAI